MLSSLWSNTSTCTVSQTVSQVNNALTTRPSGSQVLLVTAAHQNAPAALSGAHAAVQVQPQWGHSSADAQQCYVDVTCKH
jgi:hypothetical protein